VEDVKIALDSLVGIQPVDKRLGLEVTMANAFTWRKLENCKVNAFGLN
jgi:hypothetical protein